MSEVLDTRAEVARLARLISVEPEAIAFMEKVGSEGLHKFRLQLVDLFYGGTDSGLQRFASVGNLMPASVIASLTKEAVGPVLASRIAGLVDPKQAVAVVSKLPVEFVADIAVEIDPRRVEPVMGQLPAGTVNALAHELLERKEYVTLGQFVSFVDDEALSAVFEMSTDVDLLQIAFMAEDKERLSSVVDLLTDKRLSRIMKTAARARLWPEALDLLRQMDDVQYFRTIDLASKLDANTLDQMIAVAEAEVLWELVIPAMAQMTDPNKPVDALLRADPVVIKGFAEAVVAEEAWDDARELLEKMSVDQLGVMRKLLAKNGLTAQFKPVAELLAA